ncbi:hypothetical protein [Vibrio sp. TRT 1302]|uniref:hypothetical protein n=1 Tax=Vibrio sp. TRT 1302 TaxID=3418504 RepID=UPI003CF2BB5D
MKKSLLLIGLLSTSLGVSAATLEECTKLLPDGYEYTVDITFNVDKTKSEPVVTGSFGVTGGTDTPENFDISAFVECAGPLLKNVNSETDQESSS